jgi:hypothetical protein
VIAANGPARRRRGHRAWAVGGSKYRIHSESASRGSTRFCGLRITNAEIQANAFCDRIARLGGQAAGAEQK